ncbi:MAG: hypothetical protein AB1714_14555 [Acidobacteriota bacterium]
MVQLFEVLSPLPEQFRLPLIHAFEIVREEAAQTATKTDVLEVRDAIRELAEAQRRTDENVGQLARRMGELAEAQKRTEERLERLITSHDRLCDQVGALSHTVGYRLEDEACLALPGLLRGDRGIELSSPLDRRFFQLAAGRELEVNIWGEAKRNGSEVVVLGQAKSQLWKRDVDRFIETCDRFANELSPKPQIRVIVTYYLTPDVAAHAKAQDVLVYRSLDLARVRDGPSKNRLPRRVARAPTSRTSMQLGSRHRR